MKLTAIVSMLLISMCGRFNTEKQYRGTPLSGPTYLCSGQDYVAGGFWRDPASGVVTEEAQVDREPTNRWRVMLRGNVASVTSTSGTGDIQTATFAVERTAQGLLLIQADRPPGASSQIISIDTTNGSFVYSDQHTNPLWNRATVFFGACQATS